MGRWVNKALSAELFEPETLVHLLWSITEEQMKENTNETQVSSHPSAASFIALWCISLQSLQVFQRRQRESARTEEKSYFL